MHTKLHRSCGWIGERWCDGHGLATSRPTLWERANGSSGASLSMSYFSGSKLAESARNGDRPRVPWRQPSALMPGEQHEPLSTRKSLETEAQKRSGCMGLPLV